MAERRFGAFLEGIIGGKGKGSGRGKESQPENSLSEASIREQTQKLLQNENFSNVDDISTWLETNAKQIFVDARNAVTVLPGIIEGETNDDYYRRIEEEGQRMK